MFKEIIAVYSENNESDKCTVGRMQNWWLLNQVVYIVTSGL
jgi:hypothetical protein